MSSGNPIPVRHLRIGLYVHLDLGWMSHPFPMGHFRIASQEQLDTLHGLGLETVRVLPDRSAPDAVRELIVLGLLPPVAGGGVPASAASLREPSASLLQTEPMGAPLAASAPVTPVVAPAAPVASTSPDPAGADERALAQERLLTRRAEREQAEAARSLRRSLELVHAEPQAARQVCERQIEAMLGQFRDCEELAIRLLGETAGDRSALHAVNVTVLSLLLGRQLGLDAVEMFDLGVGALLHDVGKLDLPERVRWLDPQSPQRSVHERKAYEEHVLLGARLGVSMGLSAGALQVLEQHHECADGSGFPRRLDGARMSVAAHIVALTNRYDQLCNPSVPAGALTPHEALALMYAQTQSHFDARVYGAFVRMMGVYPPGSVVQLSDGRHAMVSCANLARPLRPRLLVHEPAVRPGAARVLDLQDHPQIGIRRSLKPQQLPRAALEGLSPRARVCYFFERATEPMARPAGAGS